MPSAEDHATLQAYITGVDKAAREAEAEWGYGRLPLLIDDELRAKFLRQQARWQEALNAAYDAHVLTAAQMADVAAKSAAMQRAYAALSAAASEAGHRPVLPEVWEAPLSDGKVVAIVRTHAEVSRVPVEGRYVAVYALPEVASVIEAIPEAIGLAKQVWPGARVLPPGDMSWVRGGDDLPF